MKKIHIINIFMLSVLQVFLLQSCAGEKTQYYSKNLKRYSDVIKFTGSSIKEVKSKLGSPVKHEVKKVENKHIKGQIDELHTLVYNGLTIKILVLSDTKKELVVDITISSKDWQKNLNLGVGRNSSYIKKLLGPPVDIDKNYWIYIIDEYGSQVKFNFENDIVKEVSIFPYID
ncbi:MAG: hypothetical protein N2Z73_00135 [Endomicrobia bacterium]|nr:hypothetical protein [Endomicrobiia bacterium]